MQFLTLRDDGSAVINYNFEDFSLYIGTMLMSDFPNYSVVSHWHDDVEFLLVLSGHTHANINGTIVRLEPGQGIFINYNALSSPFTVSRYGATLESWKPISGSVNSDDLRFY